MQPLVREKKTKWRVKVKWYRLILFFFYNPSCFFFMIQVDPSPVLFYFYFFIRSELVWVDPTWTGSPSPSQAPAKEIKIGGQMDGAVGSDLCIRKSSSLSICFFGWDALNNLITHIQVRHSIKIFTQFWNSSRSY